MDHRPVEFRLSIRHCAPGRDQAPNLRPHGVPQNPGLLAVRGRELIQGVWQKFIRDFGKSPRLILGDALTCLARLLDLNVAATVAAVLSPNQIQIVLSFRPCPGVASMLVEVIEQLVQNDDRLVVEAADRDPSAGHIFLFSQINAHAPASGRPSHPPHGR